MPDYTWRAHRDPGIVETSIAVHHDHRTSSIDAGAFPGFDKLQVLSFLR
jgi:hypothetical protein